MRQLKITKSVTPRDIATTKYLSDINKEGLISQDEEIILTQKIKQGDMEALEKLTKANLRFVVSVAKKYQNKGLPLPDLINEGNIGLIKAAQRFDETRGFKFISYAVWWIRQSILVSLSEYRYIRLPQNKIATIKKIGRLEQEIEQFEERIATDEEIAELLNTDVETVRDIYRVHQNTMSLDKHIGSLENGEIMTLLDVVRNTDSDTDQGLIDESLRTDLNQAMKILTEREQTILNMFFGLGDASKAQTLGQIGEKLDLSKESIRQIKDKAVKKMKRLSFTRKILRQHL